MKTSSYSQKITALASVFLLSITLVLPLGADVLYLTPGKTDAVAVLAEPPAPDSEEQAAELQLVRELCKARTESQTARAKEDAKLNLFYFAGVIGTNFAPGKFPRTEALFDEVRKEVRPPVTAAKKHWIRKRPNQIDASLLFDKPESSASYPSGHSTYGTVEALILAELYPDKRDAVLAVGRQIGWDRVITGYHYLSDVEAGRIFGQALVNEMKTSPSFQKDLAAAKAEIEASKSVK